MLTALVLLGAVVPLPGLARADEPPIALEEVRILALDPPVRAVVQLPRAPDPVVVEPGDVIDGADAVVEAIGVDKLVVEALTRDAEPTRLQAWIYRPDGPGPVRVLRLDPRRPVDLPSERPVVVLQESTAAATASEAGAPDAGGEPEESEEP
ncbi:MAG: hypothetical protein AAGF23_25575 [Acidobacteriota bacterium]